MRKSGNTALIAIAERADDVGPHELDTDPACLDDHQDCHRKAKQEDVRT